MRNPTWTIACAASVLLPAGRVHAQETSAPTVFGGAIGTAVSRAAECAAADDRSSAGLEREGAPPAECRADRKAATPLTVSAGRSLGVLSGTDGSSRDIFRLGDRISAFSFSQADIATSTASFGPTWRLKSGISYAAAGGVELTASTIVRRGYSLPIAMVQPIGSDVQTADSRNAAIEFGSAPTYWDTELRIRKVLTSGRVNVSIVGEVFNLFGAGTATNAAPGGAALKSPTVRAGAVLDF